MRTRKQAGLTLIELMVTVSIFSILMLAALSIFVAMTETQRLNERVSEANANKVLGASTIHFDLQNAGYRLPVPAFAFRHVNDVNAATTLRADGAPIPTITTLTGCAAGVGLVPGTDVIEVASGAEFIAPGVVGSVGGSALSPTVTLKFPSTFLDDGGVTDGGSGSIAPPFMQSDVLPPSPAVGSVLVFARGPRMPGPDNGAFCAGIVRNFSVAGSFSVGLDLIDRNFQNIAAASYYPVTCPEADMRAYRITSRVRYMVCGEPGNNDPTQMRLYRQRSAAAGWAQPEELQAGVENLQVSPRYQNLGNVVRPTGSGASCLGAIGSQRELCYCDDAVGASCTPPPTQVEPGITSLSPTTFPSLVRGVRVQLTTTGDRQALSNADTQNFRRPASFDRPAAGGVGDNFVRVVDSLSFSGSNFLVVP